MRRTWGIIALASFAFLQSTPTLASYTQVCARIAKSIVATPSVVYYAGDADFARLSKHWASSSDQVPACVVQPRTTSHVGKILQIVGETRTPFAIMGAGHMMTPFVASTTGVHVSMSAFTSFTFDNATKLTTFGAGLTWDAVYTALDPYGVAVAGGRAPGVGVGGLILGGGYSIHTNQHGLTLDNVEASELVKPNGKVVWVTHESDPDLFFALKGGWNNFGVVTRFTMKTFPQGPVWVGTFRYTDPSVFPTVVKVLATFSSEETDPKASLTCGVTNTQGTPSLGVRAFYDAPEPPAGMFDTLININASSSSLVGSQNFAEMVSAVTFTKDFAGVRAYSMGVSVPAYSVNFLNIVNDLAVNRNANLANKTTFFSLTSEPFLPSILSHNNHSTAFPFTRAKSYTPFNILAIWSDPAHDASVKKDMEAISDALVDALVEEGYDDVPTSPLYPNYSMWDAPLERVFGTSIPRMKRVKRRVDPGDVMGLCGGFKVTP